MFRILLIIPIFIIFTSPALAQEREYQPGIHHTKIYNSPKIQRPAPPAKPTAKPGGAQNNAHNEETDPTQRVWNKYKELASGTAQNAKSVRPPEVKEVKKPKLTAPNYDATEKKKTGLASLLEQYQQNKNNQRQMRSKTFKTPKIKAPEQQKPAGL